VCGTIRQQRRRCRLEFLGHAIDVSPSRCAPDESCKDRLGENYSSKVWI
jgi:hypothetical protein